MELEHATWKRITFTRELVQKILDGKVNCTYRKTPKLGKFLVLDSRFKPSKDASCKIHCYRSEEVDPTSLTNKDAKLAGVESAQKLRELFTNWYGSLPPIMYRNWFKVLGISESA
ncbi:MAG: hypothetical protein HYY67_01835 [Thaumarchaeota archaeon]|nr:hypothetical protein [Nitrososphaerota archaeon]